MQVGQSRRGTGPSPRARTATPGSNCVGIVRSRTSWRRGAGSARAEGSRRRRTVARAKRRRTKEGAPADPAPGRSARAARRSAPRTSSSRRARRTTRGPTARCESQKPQIRKAGMIASFVFECETYWVNGYAVQAKASVAASRWPPNRRPTRTRPSRRAGRKHRREAAAGGVALPVPAEEPVAGEVGLVGDGPYVSPCSSADSQRPFVWIRSRICRRGRPGRTAWSTSRGKWPYGVSPTRSAARRSRPRSRRRSRSSPDVEPDPEAGEKTVAAANTHTGQTGREGRGRPRIPIQSGARADRRGGG